MNGDFAARLIAWQRLHGRHGLPWQGTKDTYRIWLSEIMLQQTQVGTVIPYYLAFLERFPDVVSLAASDIDSVLRLWSGLGYYSRARNLHGAACEVMARHDGIFPRDRETLESLPGVGRSTAAAIAAFAFGAREAILDGNVKRVLARHFAVAGFPGEAKVAHQLWDIAEAVLPRQGIAPYTQALMDLGATVCTRTPACERCPVHDTCQARAQDNVAAYPGTRQRKAVPVRTTRMLLLFNQGRLLLEKRPPVGIWGGLWSFPEVSMDEDVVSVCEARFGLVVDAIRPLPALKHSFTHFTLNIHPVQCRVRTDCRVADSAATQWMDPDYAAMEAVPVPVKKLLVRLKAEPGQATDHL